MPSVPPHQDFKHKVKAKAYQAVERAGVVWVYMGARAEAPPLPAFEILDAPRGRDQRQHDPARLQLPAGARGRDRHRAFRLPAWRPRRSRATCSTRASRSTSPSPTARREYHVADAPWGTQYAGYRAAGPGRTYWRFANFLFPVLDAGAQRRVRQPRACPRLGADRRRHTHVRLHLVEARAGRRNSLPQPAYKDGTPIGGTGRGNKLLPNTTDWLGRWRMADNEANDWGMDRDGAAQQRDLQRHRRHPPAGPGDHREHGPDRRPHASSIWRPRTR